MREIDAAALHDAADRVTASDNPMAHGFTETALFDFIEESTFATEPADPLTVRDKGLLAYAVAVGAEAMRQAVERRTDDE